MRGYAREAASDNFLFGWFSISIYILLQNRYSCWFSYQYHSNAGYSAVWVYGDCRTLPCPIGVPTLVTIVDAMVLAIARASVYYYDDFWFYSINLLHSIGRWLLFDSYLQLLWRIMYLPIGIKPQCTPGTVATIAHSTPQCWSAVGFAEPYLQ